MTPFSCLKRCHLVQSGNCCKSPTHSRKPKKFKEFGRNRATRLRLDTIVGQEVAEGPVPFRLPHSDFRLLSNARTVAESLGLGMSGEGWEAGTGGAQILASGNLNNATGNMYDPVILKSYVSVFPSPQNYN